MFGLIVRKSLLYDRARTARVVFSVALGAAVTSSVLGVSIGVGDQVERELRSYGANIEMVSSQTGAGEVDRGGIRYHSSDLAASIPVSRLSALKTIFWRHNIIGFVPFLTIMVEVNGRPVPLIGTWFRHKVPVDGDPNFATGVRTVDPWWKVNGEWPADGSVDDCLVGSDLAADLHLKIHDRLVIFGHTLRVAGILSTGGAEEQEVVAPLPVVQSWVGAPGMASRVEVSALIKPEDELAHKDKSKLTDADRERLACSPYISSITSEIIEAIPGVDAHPVYRVADTEGKLLKRLQALMNFVLLAALLAALLGAGSATAAAAVQRRREIALVKAIGAPLTTIISQLAVEAILLGLAGGFIGVPFGILLHYWIGKMVFGLALPTPWIAAPVGMALALGIAMISSFLPLWTALHIDPVVVLGEEQG